MTTQNNDDMAWAAPSTLPVIEIGHLFPNYQHAHFVRRSEATDSESLSGEGTSLLSSDFLHPQKRPAEEQAKTDSDESSSNNNNNNKTKKQKTALFNGITSNSSHESCGAKQDRQKREPWASDLWEQRFEELKAFKNQHGHCLVPLNYAQNPELATWVRTSRRVYRQIMKAKETGKKPSASWAWLSDEHIDSLNELGFVWTLRRRRPRATAPWWGQRFEELKAFKSKHGHCLVPGSSGPLGRWVATQRKMYSKYVKEKEAGKPGPSTTIMEMRIKQLEEIGFAWSAQRGRRKMHTNTKSSGEH